MQLYFQNYPVDAVGQGLVNKALDQRTPVIIIPGLFGSTTNWRSFAKALAEHTTVIVIDQRNHGRSSHADSNSYDDLANDLRDFLDQHGLERVILCGHSMGGKTAMVFSLMFPERVAQLAVLDIAPVTYNHSHAPFLDELMEIDLSSLQSRSQADRALQNAIPDAGTRLFLLQSLTGSADSYRWRLNLPVLRRYMSEIVGFPDLQLANKSSDVDTIFIYGEKSDYLLKDMHERCQGLFPNAQFKGIPEAQHWLHIDQPRAVLTALLNFVQIEIK